LPPRGLPVILGGMLDPVASVLLWLAVILFAAKLGAGLAVRFGQPPVLGELLAGVVLGNAALAGVPWAGTITDSPSIALFGQLGVILLLFEVGLGTTVAEMLQAGPSALLVACLGTTGTFVLGYAAGALLLPGASHYIHAFLGVTLTATSIGITVRVLYDRRLIRRPEARVILGAAVIDDVIGLVLLATIAAAITAAGQGEAVTVGATGVILSKAVAFLVGSLVIGSAVSPRIFALGARLPVHGVLLATSLGICFALSWLASISGLAPIIGAFAAGVILKKVHYKDFADRGERNLEHLIRPISSFLAPIFFVLVGARTDLTAFARPGVLALAAALTGAAVVGKLACALGVVDRRARRFPVAAGMMPRGEVSLIVASMGLGLAVGGEPVINAETFSAIVAMVFVTAMATPPLLAWSFRRRQG